MNRDRRPLSRKSRDTVPPSSSLHWPKSPTEVDNSTCRIHPTVLAMHLTDADEDATSLFDPPPPYSLFPKVRTGRRPRTHMNATHRLLFPRSSKEGGWQAGMKLLDESERLDPSDGISPEPDGLGVSFMSGG
jgi:hypothetical protein